MHMLPMDMPAELFRRTRKDSASEEVLVASGPLVIMAYGLLSIDAADQEAFRIVSPMGELDAGQARAALRRWSTPMHGIVERDTLQEEKRRRAAN